MQTPDTTLVLLGAGGHARVVADAALLQGAWRRIVAAGIDPASSGRLLPAVELLTEPQALQLQADFHIAMGRTETRVAIAALVQGRPLATIVHPRASVSTFAEIGAGTFVAAQAIVAAEARVGASVIVNHGAIVDHGCTVGELAHLSPQSVLSGGVRIGARAFLGSGVRVLPGLSIADDVVLGAGAVVTTSITQPGTYVGIPARRLK